MKFKIFKEFDVLVPDKDKVKDLNSWPVVAVDQFTSQPEYWREVKKLVDNKFSAYYLVYPEAEFEGAELFNAGRVKKINDAMQDYLDKNLFKEYKNAYVYVERELLDGSVRTGIIGIVDLERYDFDPDLKAAIRATEKTVTERIPPRKAIRQNAPLELTHVLMLCDDLENNLIKFNKAKLEKIYDLNLMLNGGNIKGWLVTGGEAEEFNKRLEDYVNKKSAESDTPLIFAVGDGNHSLATAKACWEELKANNPGKDLSNHPARYAMVELENIHEESQKFEPVHRLLKNVNAEALLNDIKKICVEDKNNSWPVEYVNGDKSGVLYLNKDLGILVTEILQNYLDNYMQNNKAENIEIDFIHEDKALKDLASQSENNVGFLLPAIDKTQFFNWVVVNGILPRKTFSMGHAQEKRYYLEARKIK
ncbi:MAG: DUF1015 domain-containing protein [Synergistaceae bacterium]|nr:DUF1015 domain-containing protein [Synergistaceae bacterium]MBR0221556.1 DUF1015 domain-containing protein [Synergistaceae bacterium]